MCWNLAAETRVSDKKKKTKQKQTHAHRIFFKIPLSSLLLKLHTLKSTCQWDAHREVCLDVRANLKNIFGCLNWTEKKNAHKTHGSPIKTHTKKHDSALSGRPGVAPKHPEHTERQFPLTSSEAWAPRPGEGGGGGGGSGTSGQNCSCNCLGASGPLCSPWRPPRAGAARASRARWSWCCGDAPPLIRCHASWSFYTWSVYSETIFSPKERSKKKKAHNCHCG